MTYTEFQKHVNNIRETAVEHKTYSDTDFYRDANGNIYRLEDGCSTQILILNGIEYLCDYNGKITCRCL